MPAPLSIVTPSRRLLPRKTVLFIEHLLATVGGGGGNGSRSISNCVDCRTEDLALPGGTFWRVGIDLVHSPRLGYGLTVAYQRYREGAGLTQELYIGVDMWLRSSTSAWICGCIDGLH